MVVLRSESDHAQVVKRLLAALEQRGLIVFARIDHAGAARAAGLTLADEEVVVFGNPKAGTLLMQSDPRVGIELPLRMLVWRAGDATMVGYEDPRELAARYEVGDRDETLEGIAALLAALAREAAG